MSWRSNGLHFNIRQHFTKYAVYIAEIWLILHIVLSIAAFCVYNKFELNKQKDRKSVPQIDLASTDANY